MKFKLLFIFIIFFSKAEAYKYQLAICAIFRDEARFLKEWIDYHRLVGVQHFWLYNNSSVDHYLDVLAPYIKAGIVELFQKPSEPGKEDHHYYTYKIQCGAYNDALKKARGVSKWLAIIDIDEFLVPVKGKCIVDVLEKHFSNVSGLYLNWIFFGTSHIEEIKSDEYLIEKLNHRADLSYESHLTGKCIVKPLHVTRCQTPHFCLYKKGKYHVDASLYPCGTKASGVFVDKIRINHYWVKDLKFMYEVKIPRTEKWGLNSQTVIEADDKTLNVVEDPIMDKFVKKLRKRAQ